LHQQWRSVVASAANDSASWRITQPAFTSQTNRQNLKGSVALRRGESFIRKIFMTVNSLEPKNNKPLFALGRLTATQFALQFLERIEMQPLLLLRRHMLGDWGDLDSGDIEANKQSIQDGSRILSAYMLNGEKVYVITEGDRSITTILMAAEY
jgi:hypothetical protein